MLFTFHQLQRTSFYGDWLYKSHNLEKSMKIQYKSVRAHLFSKENLISSDRAFNLLTKMVLSYDAGRNRHLNSNYTTSYRSLRLGFVLENTIMIPQYISKVRVIYLYVGQQNTQVPATLHNRSTCLINDRWKFRSRWCHTKKGNSVGKLNRQGQCEMNCPVIVQLDARIRNHLVRDT